MNAYALTTVARLKSYMKKTDSTDDALLAILIDVCTDMVENYCDRRFKKTVYSQQVYDGSGTKNLLLKNYPVDRSATFTLEQRATSLNEELWNTIDSTLYHLDDVAGMVTLMSGLTVYAPINQAPLSGTDRFAKLPRQFRVTFTAGYAFENVDTNNLVTLESIGIGDLEMAVWQLCKKAFLTNKQNTDIQSESIGDYSVTFREMIMIDPLITAILSRYVRADANL